MRRSSEKGLSKGLDTNANRVENKKHPRMLHVIESKPKRVSKTKPEPRWTAFSKKIDRPSAAYSETAKIEKPSEARTTEKKAPASKPVARKATNSKKTKN